MTTSSHNSTTPSVSVTTASGNNQSQLVATPVPDEQRISFWPQHFGLIPQWVTLEHYRLRDYALQHPECSAIMRIID
ncbi:antirestriction protein [Escherichia coli]|uniref:antirestriction protein n=1 Tax=Escherichia coli TaxID=562 RepID=UPI001F4AD0E3|nr:antirestriction protein [Escherichia coli]